MTLPLLPLPRSISKNLTADMGDIRKINNEYYIEFQARGLLYQQKAGKDIARARSLLAEIESKIRQGATADRIPSAKGSLRGGGTLVRDVDVDIFFQTFLENAQKEYAPRSFRRFETVIGNFHEFLKKEFSRVTKLSEVTPAVLESYRVFLIKPVPSSPKPKLVDFTLLLLRVVFTQGVNLGYTNDNPTVHVLFSALVQRRRPATLTDPDMDKLLENFSAEKKDFFIFLAGTGARPAEALELRWQNVDFRERSLKIAQREVPMDMDVLGLLEKKRAAAAFGDKELVFSGLPRISELEEDLTRSVKRSKLAGDIRLGTFRHSFARRLLAGGVSPVRVCRLMGLEDIARVMYYWQWMQEIDLR